MIVASVGLDGIDIYVSDLGGETILVKRDLRYGSCIQQELVAVLYGPITTDILGDQTRAAKNSDDQCHMLRKEAVQRVELVRPL